MEEEFNATVDRNETEFSACYDTSTYIYQEQATLQTILIILALRMKTLSSSVMAVYIGSDRKFDKEQLNQLRRRSGVGLLSCPGLSMSFRPSDWTMPKVGVRPFFGLDGIRASPNECSSFTLGCLGAEDGSTPAGCGLRLLESPSYCTGEWGFQNYQIHATAPGR